MSYLAIKDLKNSRSLREKIEKERELILTKDGQPCALLIGVTPDNLEESLKEVRRAMFSKTVARARKKEAFILANNIDIQNEIIKSRKSRGLK
jgi:antitoxin (DNA-binding transcriptional repressor) of toxin-antitoxin stability system